MRLTRDQVLHVAELAKLKLTDVEVDLFQEQLSAILEYARRLDELETESILPTAGVLPLRNVMRPDQARPSYPRQAMLGNAPETEDGFVRVKAVLDADELAR
jgi:aspartyl-tRNA(Asn)/glutamyl-tRNA(Gln) amidotransferase subunit C